MIKNIQCLSHKSQYLNTPFKYFIFPNNDFFFTTYYEFFRNISFSIWLGNHKNLCFMFTFIFYFSFFPSSVQQSSNNLYFIAITLFSFFDGKNYFDNPKENSGEGVSKKILVKFIILFFFLSKMIHRSSNKNFRRIVFSRLYPLPFPNKLMGNFFAFHNFCLLSFSIRCWVALGSTGKIIARLECWKILEKSFQLHFRIMNLNLIIFVSTFCVLHLWT